MSATLFYYSIMSRKPRLLLYCHSVSEVWQLDVYPNLSWVNSKDGADEARQSQFKVLSEKRDVSCKSRHMSVRLCVMESGLVLTPSPVQSIPRSRQPIYVRMMNFCCNP